MASTSTSQGGDCSVRVTRGCSSSSTRTAGILATEPIAGVPDVVFLNPLLGHLYVAIGDPGVIEVFETAPLRRHEVVSTETGAHTLSFDATRNLVCAFLPATHRAAVYRDHA